MTQETLPGRWDQLAAAVAVGGWILLATGCAVPPPTRTNAPPQGQSPTQHRLHEHYIRMTDNALLADMSMSAVHFVPRTAELNALGVRRLMRHASILKVYGGTLRYDGTEADRELRKDRVEQIREFLVASGLEPDQFDVEQGMAGGSGIAATEALGIRKATRGPGDLKVTSGSGGGQ